MLNSMQSTTDKSEYMNTNFGVRVMKNIYRTFHKIGILDGDDKVIDMLLFLVHHDCITDTLDKDMIAYIEAEIRDQVRYRELIVRNFTLESNPKNETVDDDSDEWAYDCFGCSLDEEWERVMDREDSHNEQQEGL